MANGAERDDCWDRVVVTAKSDFLHPVSPCYFVALVVNILVLICASKEKKTSRDNKRSILSDLYVHRRLYLSTRATNYPQRNYALFKTN